jgi:sulfite reductase (ferredoxin)
VNGHVLPAYRVTLGGRCNLQGARLGSPIGQVPAKSLPDLICDFARDFVANETDGETFSAYFERTGQEHFVEILNRHSAVPLFEDRPLFYRDYGSEELFSLAGRGAGECGAGVFELIQEDLTAASKAVDPFEILLATCRALLITRGIDSGNADTVFRSFEEHFVNTGLVGEHFRPLLLRARSFLQGWKEALQNSTGEANRLLDRIKLLFSTLDSNLEFHPPEKETSSPQPAKSSKPKAEPIPGNHKLDLRGVACPTNFVRAKLKLETMEAGEALEIILDDGPPIQNVPASFRAEGQEVARMAETEDGHWEITVRKARPAAIA